MGQKNVQANALRAGCRPRCSATLIVVPDARAGQARSELSSHNAAQRCPGMPGCCRLALRSHLQGRRKSSQSWRSGAQKTPQGRSPSRLTTLPRLGRTLRRVAARRMGAAPNVHPRPWGSEAPLASGGLEADHPRGKGTAGSGSVSVVLAKRTRGVYRLGVHLYPARCVSIWYMNV